MATTKRKAAPAKTKTTSSNTSLLPNEAAEPKNSAASFISAPTRKYPGTVTVFYNHPRSIIFTVTDSRGVEQKLLINGNATNLRGLPKGILPSPGTYGRTPDVDGELWEAVETKYAKMPIFRNGLIFAVSAGDTAKSELEARKGLRNGYEPIDPKHTRTEPKSDND